MKTVVKQVATLAKPFGNVFVHHAALVSFLVIFSLANPLGRKRILVLNSSHFGDSDSLKLLSLLFLLILLLILSASILIFSGLVQNSGTTPTRTIQTIPVFIALIFVLLPAFKKYFAGLPVFSDLKYTIGFLADESVLQVSDSNLVYPSSFLWMRRLPLPFENPNLILYLSFFGCAIFLISVAHLSCNLNYIGLIVLSGLLVSPAMTWLVESQNIDLLIASTIYLISVAYTETKKLMNALCIFLLTILALVKFYTIPILAILFMISKKAVTKFFLALSLVLLLPLLYADFSKVVKSLPLGQENNALGLKVLNYFLGLDWGVFSLLFLGVLLVFSGFFFVRNSLESESSRQDDGEPCYTLIFMMTIMTMSFLSTANFPYRLIFLLFVLPKIVDSSRDVSLKVASSLALVSFFVLSPLLGILANSFLAPLILLSVKCFIQTVWNLYRRWVTISIGK